MLLSFLQKNKYWLAPLLCCLFIAQPISATDAKRLLMIVSSYGENQGEDKPGFEFDELAKAYLTFTENGIDVDIASPNGGKVEADRYDPKKSYNQKVLADKQAMKKLANTLSINDVRASDYAGIFIVGGKGAMFDLPENTTLQSTIATIYQSGGTVGAVCHGPAALVNVKLDNGDYLIAGKKVNGFTNFEEQLFGKKWVKHFDFLLEDKLKIRAALFESSPMMLSHVAVDERLITGQNPTSTVDTAKAMLSAMGLAVKPGNDYRDDKTLKLVAKILAGEKEAENRYLSAKPDYETPLLGMYGYYHFMAAQSDDEIHQALKLMNLAQTDMQHPQLGLQIAKAHQKLGQTERAKIVLEKLIDKNPDLGEAKTLLEQL